MGYMNMDNLYKAQEILMMRRCYALEKIHGTSAHIQFKDGDITFFGGGIKHETFVALFDKDALIAKFKEIFGDMFGVTIKVHGEAYGGSCQKMSNTYGKELRFIVFDVLVGDSWLNVPNANDVADNLGLEFVAWEEISTDLDAIDAARDADSVQAKRNGIDEPRKREGVVLRPLIEMHKNNGKRIIVKHKGTEFEERKTPQKVINPDKLKVLQEATAIADEWVTDMRLTHVLDQLASAGKDVESITVTGDVVKAMIDDVVREAGDEIVDSKPARTAIGRKAAEMFKARVTIIRV